MAKRESISWQFSEVMNIFKDTYQKIIPFLKNKERISYDFRNNVDSILSFKCKQLWTNWSFQVLINVY